MAETGMGHYGQVVKEIRGGARDFHYVDFAHESRHSNIDAYTLVRS